MTTKKELCIVEDKDSHLEEKETMDSSVEKELDSEVTSEETVEEVNAENTTDEVAELQAALEEKEDAYLRLQAELANIQKKKSQRKRNRCKISFSIFSERINQCIG